MLRGELRRATGYSQKTLAAKLRMKRRSLSKLENAWDMQVTTLRKIVGALGGELEIVCKFPKGDVRLVQFDRTLTSPGSVRRMPAAEAALGEASREGDRQQRCCCFRAKH